MSRQAAVARKTVAPRAPRRVSGRHGPMSPSLRPLPAGVPARTTIALPSAGRAGQVLDRLLRSRAWIWLIGLGLGGIVAMQVSLLKLNAGISRAVESAATLERQNAQLEAEVAHLSSGERIRLAAEKLGMVAPQAGAVSYLTARDSDAGLALSRMTAPSPEAQQLLANGGRTLPGSTLTATATIPAQASEPAPPTAITQPQSASPTPAQSAPTTGEAEAVDATSGGAAAPAGQG